MGDGLANTLPARLPAVTFMSAVACPHCGAVVNAPDLAGQMVACPTCAGQFVMPGAVPPPAQGFSSHRRKHKASASPWPLIITAGLFLVPVIACGVICSGAASNRKPDPTYAYGDARDSRTQSDARIAGKNAILGVLKFPKDAEFVGYPVVMKGKDGNWGVSGDVKAANAFGAKLTHEYVVVLSCDAKRKTWTVETVLYDGKVYSP